MGRPRFFFVCGDGALCAFFFTDVLAARAGADVEAAIEVAAEGVQADDHRHERLLDVLILGMVT